MSYTLQERLAFLSKKAEEADLELKQTGNLSAKLLTASLLAECGQLAEKIEQEKEVQRFVSQLLIGAVSPLVQNNIASILEKNKTVFSELPINIEAAAKICGIEKIQYVSEQQSGKHACLENNIIYVNNVASYEKQRFAIAHEIGHKLIDNKRSKTLKKVARMGNAQKEKMFSDIYNLTKLERENLFWDEVIDYFAANLLMPHNQFVERENQNDKELAALFGVTEKAIAKRREEIKTGQS
jgi:Zn-dependent peptidase ImmA (M78 family)/uncharacterized protein YejL (UPF0352 family)